MLKLLIWGLVIYFVYNYFQKKARLWAGEQRNSFKQHPPPPEDNSNGRDEEGEYIDYEEIK